MEDLQPSFGCDDQGTLESLMVTPKDPAVITDLLDVNDGSVFYGDFQLPEFPCMSLSWSPTTAQAPMKLAGSSSITSSTTVASASSLSPKSFCATIPATNGGAPEQLEALFSTVSMEMILQKPPEDTDMVAAAAFSTDAATATSCGIYQCMDMMESFGYMGSLERNDEFDPTLIFSSESPFNEAVDCMGCFGLDHEDQKHGLELIPRHREDEDDGVVILDMRCDDLGGLAVGDDMRAVFLEWLQANRDSISTEDLRKVKIKKSTIEMAVRRLGGGKEAMKQLLKLILEWVQTNHLHQKHAVDCSNFDQQLIKPNPNPNPNFLPAQPVFPAFTDFSNATDSSFTSQWAPLTPACIHPGLDRSPSAVGSYMGSELMDFPMADSTQSWLPAVQWPQYDYTENFQPTLGSPQVVGGSGYGYPGQYPLQYFGSGGSSRLNFARLGSSATKEARKNRMARQKRSLSHQHHRVSNSRRQDGSHHKVMAEQGGSIIGSESYSADSIPLDANWMYWPSNGQGRIAAGESFQVHAAETPDMHHPPQSFPRSVPTEQPDMNQDWKPDSNLKFLLQKMLKQSDVGNLGRIVLPKKEAEAHLPELEVRDGISISMEDIGNSRVWNMRYRFWPNNKSRMYVLENTGDFVRTNGLKEGDFIVIYSDLKSGKYLIRGVKVHQSEGGH